jgi:hypothetical protein
MLSLASIFKHPNFRLIKEASGYCSWEIINQYMLFLAGILGYEI